MSCLHWPLKADNTTVVPERPSLLIPINLSTEQGMGSQAWPLKFELDLTLCLQLSNVSATVWLLSSSGSQPLTPDFEQIGEGGVANLLFSESDSNFYTSLFYRFILNRLNYQVTICQG